MFLSVYFDFEFTFKDLSFLPTLGIVDLEADPDTRLFGTLSPLKNESGLSIYSTGISLYGIDFYNPDLHISIEESLLDLMMNSEKLSYQDGPDYLRNNFLHAYAKNDTLVVNLDWMEEDSSQALVPIESIFSDGRNFELRSKDSRFTFLEKDWFISNAGRIRYDSAFSIGFRFSC